MVFVNENGENTPPPPAGDQPGGQPTWRPAPPPGYPYAAQASPAVQQPTQQPTQPSPLVRDSRKRRTTFAAGVIAASLLVGGGAGIGGAAAYSALNDDGGGAGGTGASTSVTTSKVVDTPDATAADGSVEAVAQKVLPSVVKIDVSGAQGSGSGSGIILSSDGRILTNNHVVALAGQGGSLTVTFNDGSHATATVLGTDPLTDTALIQAQDVSGLTPATIGKSSDLKVGEPVVAVGSPLGLQATVTSGIVSALDRPVNVGSQEEGTDTVYPAIQTDAAINPGNSGGALTDSAGNVVGINAAIATAGSSQMGGGESGNIGVGFAIPIDEVMPIVDEMANGQTPTHARLGVQVGNATDGQGAQITDGASIQVVNAGSTAQKAGIQAGDVITKVDDHLISDADSLVATIRSYRPGDQVTVTYERGGQTDTAQLTLDSDAETSSS